MGEPSVYCEADDGSWSIWLHPCAIYKNEQWIDSYYVSVLLPKDVPNPWAETKPLTVGISFDSFEAAFAHVSRSDLMVWALTVHAIELSDAVVHWRRRTEDVDPTNKKFRALEYLDDIRCAILDTGWPLGDDSDPELTPVRLVKETLAENAKLRECNMNQTRMLHRLLTNNKPKIEVSLPTLVEYPLRTYAVLTKSKKEGE